MGKQVKPNREYNIMQYLGYLYSCMDSGNLLASANIIAHISQPKNERVGVNVHLGGKCASCLCIRSVVGGGCVCVNVQGVIVQGLKPEG